MKRGQHPCIVCGSLAGTLFFGKERTWLCVKHAVADKRAKKNGKSNTYKRRDMRAEE